MDNRIQELRDILRNSCEQTGHAFTTELTFLNNTILPYFPVQKSIVLSAMLRFSSMGGLTKTPDKEVTRANKARVYSPKLKEMCQIGLKFQVLR